MARSRNIKPGLCQNPELAELAIEVRFLFAVLPMFADREGRLEDRPKKVKMQAFPADNLDVEPMLQALHDAGFIERYAVDDQSFIQIVNFAKHQHPHRAEAHSTIPAPCGHSASPVQPPGEQGAKPADSLNLIPDSLKDRSSVDDRFGDFWLEYPKKRKKKDAQKIWVRLKLNRIADQIIADVIKRKQADGQWLDGYIPNPTTYLNGELWTDDFAPVKQKTNGTAFAIPKRDEDLEAWARLHGLRPSQPGESYVAFRQRLSEELQRQPGIAKPNSAVGTAESIAAAMRPS